MKDIHTNSTPTLASTRFIKTQNGGPIVPLIQNLLSRLFSPSAVSLRPAQATHNTYWIPYMVLAKGFQLFDKELFSTTRRPEMNSEPITDLKTLYKKCQSLVEDHLLDTNQTSIDTLCRFEREEDGAFCTYIEYDNKFGSGNNAHTIQWVSLLIGNKNAEGDEQPIHVAITGYMNTQFNSPDSLFTCQEVRCLGNLDGEQTFFAPETDLDMVGLFAYANQAFLQVISGLPLTPLENQKWITPERLSEAVDIYQSMRYRTSETLKGDIDNFVRQQTVRRMEGFILPSPPH